MAPHPLTHDQLLMLADHTDRTVRKALRKYRRSALAGFVILAGGIGAAFAVTGHDANVSRHAIVQSGRAVAVDSCNGRYQDREGVRNVLRAAQVQEHVEFLRGTVTPAQHQRALAFYSSQLARLKLPDCRKAAAVITSDPAHTVKIPRALHPPDQTLLNRQLHDAIPLG